MLTREFPVTPENPDEFEYPFPDASNALLYDAYRQRAESIPQLLVCGRLGEYRYYDMDQAIARAMLHARGLLCRRVARLKSTAGLFLDLELNEATRAGGTGESREGSISPKLPIRSGREG